MTAATLAVATIYVVCCAALVVALVRNARQIKRNRAEITRLHNLHRTVS